MNKINSNSLHQNENKVKKRSYNEAVQELHQKILQMKIWNRLNKVHAFFKYEYKNIFMQNQRSCLCNILSFYLSSFLKSSLFFIVFYICKLSKQVVNSNIIPFLCSFVWEFSKYLWNVLIVIRYHAFGTLRYIYIDVCYKK